MDREDIIKKSNEIIIDTLGIDASEIKDTTELAGDLGLDSLDCVDLMMKFEKELSIDISFEEMEQVKTIQDIYDLIEKKV
jgi:acyl carrier protein